MISRASAKALTASCCFPGKVSANLRSCKANLTKIAPPPGKSPGHLHFLYKAASQSSLFRNKHRELVSGSNVQRCGEGPLFLIDQLKGLDFHIVDNRDLWGTYFIWH